MVITEANHRKIIAEKIYTKWLLNVVSFKNLSSSALLIRKSKSSLKVSAFVKSSSSGTPVWSGSLSRF